MLACIVQVYKNDINQEIQDKQNVVTGDTRRKGRDIM